MSSPEPTPSSPEPPPSSPEPTSPRRAHLRGVLALVVVTFFLCAGTPGMRGLNPKRHFQPKWRAKVERKAGAAAPFFFGAIWVNHYVRVPISKHLAKFQSVFRIAQSWGLYGSGQQRVGHLIIEVDGQPVHRTNDSELSWLSTELGHRKIRPMPETMVNKLRAFNWNGFSRFVLERSQEDFPDAREVRILAEWQKRNVGAEPWIHHGRRAQAPDWKWELLGEGGVVLPPEEQLKGNEKDPGEDAQ